MKLVALALYVLAYTVAAALSADGRPAEAGADLPLWPGLGQTSQVEDLTGRRLLAKKPNGAAFSSTGSWLSGMNSGIIVIHAVMMKTGEVVGWTPWVNGGYSSTVLNPIKRTNKQILGNCGIHNCKNAFCGAQVTSANQDIFLLGGHSKDVQWYRHYNFRTGKLWATTLSSPRWYPGLVTLPDGKIMVIGGVKKSGIGGWGALQYEKQYDNPTYQVIDPYKKIFYGDKDDMREQFHRAWPVHEYPLATITPDGGLVVASGSTLYKYMPTADPGVWKKAFAYDDCPHPPRSYPQAGPGLPLPLYPPHNTMFWLHTGGSSVVKANDESPASNKAHVIELTAGKNAKWYSAGIMPYPRVMGDGLVLCDGTIFFSGGASKGVMGWGKDKINFKFRDGSGYKCPTRCGRTGQNFVYEPAIFNPETQQWSKPGSLAMAMRPRGYHSLHLLMPDCRVMAAGSDVTGDKTAEFFSPPSLSAGPRPVIVNAPDDINWAQQIAIQYTSQDPVTRVLMIRAGSATHSVNFDARALWLQITGNANGYITVLTPVSPAIAPPGMYFIVLNTAKGVPSVAKIVSL